MDLATGQPTMPQMKDFLAHLAKQLESRDPPLHDKTYFFDDGDCTFLVEGVLFKLHKIILGREPQSAFSSMFQNAIGEETEIIQLDDTAEEMRALCWILYALPMETYALVSQPSGLDVMKFIRILHLTDKYALPNFCTWAWTLMSADSSALSTHLQTCTEEHLEYILHLSDRCKETAPDFIGLVEAAWMTRIEAGEISHAYGLTVAESADRRALQGLIYLDLRKQLCHGPFVASPSAGLAHFGLTELQLTRLLFGHAILSNMLNVQGTHRPNIFQNCPHSTRCRVIWETIPWDQRDPLSFRVAATTRDKVKNAPCVAAHLEATEYPTRENIADFFLGRVFDESDLARETDGFGS